MANTDGFIEEVTEELRRDQLYAMFRKWGWLPILLIVLLVGGAAYREYYVAQQRSAAQNFGDALIAALQVEDPEARVAAIGEVEATDASAQILLALMAASLQAGTDGADGAADGLRVLADGADVDPLYRDLLLLRAQLLDPGEGLENMAVLDTLALPGRPFRPLAMEQQALLQARVGDVEAAVSILRILEQDSQATDGLQERASQLIVALEAGSVLQDAPVEIEEPAPETVEEETVAAPEEGAETEETLTETETGTSE